VFKVLVRSDRLAMAAGDLDAVVEVAKEKKKNK
jgi:hypothetical protein